MPAPNRPVVAVDRLTGRVTARFDSLNEAADAYGMYPTDVWAECKNRYYPAKRFDVIRYADDPEPIDFGRKNRRCVVASDGKTVHVWPCVSRAAEDSSLSYYGVRGRIDRGTTLDLLGREMLARYADRPLNRNARVVRHV